MNIPGEPIHLRYFAPPHPTPREIWEERERNARARAGESRARQDRQIAEREARVDRLLAQALGDPGERS